MTTTLPDRGQFLIAGLEEHPRPTYEFLVGGDLMIVEGAYPAPLCEALVSLAAANPSWENSTLAPPGNSAAYVDPNRRSSSKLTLGLHPMLVPFERSLVRVAQACLSIYQMRNIFANVSGAPIFELLRYTVGQRFDEHIDLIPGHPSWGRRRVSVLVYPNDNYQGGELLFTRQNLTIKPRAGSLVLFPSDYTFPHASTPVVQGTKFAAVAWFT
jgi:prolyl 4-hydroxylase